MSTPANVLVIDFHTDNAALLVRSLIRKFPRTAVGFYRDPALACRTVEAGEVDAAVVHRTEEVDAVSIVAMLRRADPRLPIVVVSSVDRRAVALAAGAAEFLPYDEWQRLGAVVETILQPPPARPEGESASGDRAG